MAGRGRRRDQSLVRWPVGWLMRADVVFDVCARMHWRSSFGAARWRSCCGRRRALPLLPTRSSQKIMQALVRTGVPKLKEFLGSAAPDRQTLEKFLWDARGDVGNALNMILDSGAPPASVHEAAPIASPVTSAAAPPPPPSQPSQLSPVRPPRSVTLTVTV